MTHNNTSTHYSEQLSAMMDGELGDANITDSDIKRLVNEKSSVDQWERYHLIRDVMQDNVLLTTSIADKVQAALEDEPTILAPKALKSNRPAKKWYKPAVSFAIAASAASVMWFGLSLNKLTTPEQNVTAANQVQLQIPPTTVASNQQAANQPSFDVVRIEYPEGLVLSPEQQARMDGYLFDHLELAGQRGMPRVVPHSRLVGFGRQ